MLMIISLNAKKLFAKVKKLLNKVEKILQFFK